MLVLIHFYWLICTQQSLPHSFCARVYLIFSSFLVLLLFLTQSALAKKNGAKGKNRKNPKDSICRLFSLTCFSTCRWLARIFFVCFIWLIFVHFPFYAIKKDIYSALNVSVKEEWEKHIHSECHSTVFVVVIISSYFQRRITQIRWKVLS